MGTVAVEGHRPNRPQAAATLTDSGPTTTLVRHLVPTFAIAAAAAGIVEVAVARVGAPLLGFLAPDGAAAGAILEAVGRGATAATALLVVAATGLIVGWHRGTLTAIALPFGALVLTLTATANASPGLLAASHLATAAAVYGLVLGNQGSGSGGRTALTLGAVAVVAGQLSFLAAGGASTGLHRLAQAALILLPAVTAWNLRSMVGRFTWVAAGAGAVAMWAALAVRSPEMAMLSTWAIGATLAIPALTLVAAAAGWVALAGAAIRRPGLHLVVAGVVLLWVAGVQPTAVHHNLTGLLGVMVLAGLAAERNDASRGVRP